MAVNPGACRDHGTPDEIIMSWIAQASVQVNDLRQSLSSANIPAALLESVASAKESLLVPKSTAEASPSHIYRQEALSSLRNSGLVRVCCVPDHLVSDFRDTCELPAPRSSCDNRSHGAPRTNARVAVAGRPLRLLPFQVVLFRASGGVVSDVPGRSAPGAGSQGLLNRGERFDYGMLPTTLHASERLIGGSRVLRGYSRVAAGRRHAQRTGRVSCLGRSRFPVDPLQRSCSAGISPYAGHARKGSRFAAQRRPQTDARCDEY